MSRLSYVLRSALCAGAVLSVGCASQKAAPKQPAVPVRVSPVVSMAATVTIVSNGVVEPLNTVSVQPQVGGTLTEVNFHEGDNVKVGQVLFRIDPRPFNAALRQAEAMLARDTASAKSARRDAARYTALATKDFVTKSQADEEDAAAAALEATVKSDSAAVETAKLNLEYTTITSPISGRTGRLLVRMGNLVAANSGPLVVINQLQPILVRFPVPEAQFSALQRRSGQGSVLVHVAAPDSTPIPEAGSLSFIDNAVDSMTSTVTAKAQFANVAGALWPGEYMAVTVQLDVQAGALAVPSVAVIPGQDGNYVFIVGDDHTAKMRPVTVGREVGRFTVIAKGVSAGEHVVVDGQSRLTSGTKVDARDEAAPAAASTDAPRSGGPGT
jgi:membrane fusion protein, multidrug efflux system